MLGIVSLEIEPLSLIASANSTGVLDLLELEIEPLAPSITVSFINASESTLEWDSEESYADIGIAAAKSVTVSVLPGDASVFSHPAWLTIVDEDDPITTGGTVSMYPTVSNDSYNDLTGTVVFKNIVGTAFNLIVTHNKRVGDPATPLYCSLGAKLFDENNLSIDIFTKSAKAFVGVAEVNLTFIPYYPGKATGESYTLYWYAKFNGTYDGSNGSFTAQNGQYNFQDINLLTLPDANDVLAIYLTTELI